MKKIAVTMLMAMVINIFYPLMPQAHAAFLDDALAQMVAQDPTSSRVMELLNLKKDIEQGNKEAVLGTLTKKVLERTGAGNLATAISGGSIGSMVETTLRQQVGQAVRTRLAPYEKDISTIATLLNLGTTLNPQTSQENNSLAGAPQNYRRILDLTATAYGPGAPDNGKWGNLTYMGGIVEKGVAAVDPRVIPMGSKLWIEGYGPAIASDQGSAIKGNRIDLAFNKRQEALDYGIQKVKVYVLN